MFGRKMVPERWTGALVKERLPLVRVWFEGRVYTVRVYGRTHATVAINCGCALCKAGYMHHAIFSWDAVASALNSGMTLEV